MPHHGNGLMPFFAGPVLTLFLLAVLACAFLMALMLHRQDALIRRVEQAVDLLPPRRARCLLWGVSAAVLDFAGSALLVQTHILALLGLALLAIGLTTLGAGFAVAAITVGSALGNATDGDDTPLASFRSGIVILLLAACVPWIGWLLALGWLATGTGAVLEVLVTRQP